MVGLELVRQVRLLTDKAIVAIGGITVDRAASVIAAGADSVAVIRDVLCAAKPAEQARRFLETLEAANHAAAV